MPTTLSDSVIRSAKGRGAATATGVGGVFTLTEILLNASTIGDSGRVAISGIVGFVFGGGLSWAISYVRLLLIEAGVLRSGRDTSTDLLS